MRFEYNGNKRNRPETLGMEEGYIGIRGTQRIKRSGRMRRLRGEGIEIYFELRLYDI